MQLIYPVITSKGKAFIHKFIDKFEKYDESMISRLPRFTFRINLSSVQASSFDAMWNGKCT